MTLLYQTEAVSQLKTAEDFARSYWDKPRKIENVKQNEAGELEFQVQDGIATYIVKYAKAEPGVSPALYKVFRK